MYGYMYAVDVSLIRPVLVGSKTVVVFITLRLMYLLSLSGRCLIVCFSCGKLFVQI